MRPFRDMRISVTDRCNMRCRYCMPKEVFGPDFDFMPRRQLLDFDEINRVVKAGTNLGVRKLRLTGGEPLLRRGIETLVEKLSQHETIEDLCMTTNGLALSNKKASALKQAGLSRVTISLDALDEDVFAKITDSKAGVAKVLEAIETADRNGLKPVKVNCVVRKGHNENQILPLARYFKGSDVVLRFIEFMDVGNHNKWSMEKVFSARQILQTLEGRFAIRPLSKTAPEEVANRWSYADGSGEFGIIASITRPFCGACARGRLAADGQFFTCLFAQSGFDLRSLLRAGASDQELTQKLASVWEARSDQYSLERTQRLGQQKVEMHYVGG